MDAVMTPEVSIAESTKTPDAAAMALTGTAVVSAFVHLPPCVILPGGNFKLSQWGVSQSGAHSFEYTVGWIER